MTTQVGTILTLTGHTTPFYPTGPSPSFILDSISDGKQWNYDDSTIPAELNGQGNLVVGTAYQIKSIGTTNFALYGAIGPTGPGVVDEVFIAAVNPLEPPVPYGMYPYKVGTGTGTVTVAGVQRLAQPLPAHDQVAGGYSWTDLSATGPIGGSPQTPGSPYPTQNFVVEILYLATTGPTGSGPLGPDFSQSVEQFRQLCLTGPTYLGLTGPTGTTINSAFGLNLS